VFFRLVLITLSSLVCQLAKAEFVVLYDGNGLPASQSRLVFRGDSIISGGTASQSAVAGGVSLITDNAVSAGYTNFSAPNNGLFPSLDRTNGFQLSFSAQVNSEVHTNDDRAGFSVILLGADRKGIELGFWQNEIWAQTAAPPFTHGAGVNWDTTVRTNYDLTIVHDTYTLKQGTTTLLSGLVQDYSPTGIFPYTLGNFLFLGDNTSSGGVDVVLGAITLQSNLSAVPEPSSLTLLGLVLSGLTLRRRRE
jgi:hypothetical protein